MAEKIAKMGLKFGYGGQIHKVINVDDGYDETFANTVTTEGDYGKRTVWSQKGLEVYLETYPKSIID